MAEIPCACPDCGETGAMQVVEEHDLRVLVWTGTFGCELCGAVAEDCGRGDLPRGWRDAVLAQDGEWQLSLEPADPVAALRVLRAALRLSAEETAALRARLPGAVRSGTRAEMELLQLRLAASGERSGSVTRRPGRTDQAGPERAQK